MWGTVKTPSIDRAVIAKEPSFVHACFNDNITEGVGHIPIHAWLNPVVMMVSPFEGYRRHEHFFEKDSSHCINLLAIESPITDNNLQRS